MGKRLELGVIVSLDENLGEKLQKLTPLGLTTCQLSCWRPQMLTDAMVQTVRKQTEAIGVRVSCFWAGYSGPARWNFIEGPSTIGLVPRKYRRRRVAELKKGAAFAAKIGTTAIATHVGFIHEDPGHPDYRPLVEAIREVAVACAELGLDFLFETGQETPVTLLRVIEDLNMPHVGINLDPANLILYGKSNPVDALDVFGRFVRGLHAKDGRYPTNGRELGHETPLGKGQVDFPTLLRRLKKLGFQAPVTIEREIRGPKQVRDIKAAMRYLAPML